MNDPLNSVIQKPGTKDGNTFFYNLGVPGLREGPTLDNSEGSGNRTRDLGQTLPRGCRWETECPRTVSPHSRGTAGVVRHTPFSTVGTLQESSETFVSLLCLRRPLGLALEESPVHRRPTWMPSTHGPDGESDTRSSRSTVVRGEGR